VFRIPPLAIGSQIFAGPALGIARGAIEHVVEDLSGRKGVLGPRIADLPTAQARVAEADAEADGAAALLARDAEAAMRYAEAGERPPLQVRANWRRNNAFAGQLCVRAVERLYTLMGARGLDQSSLFMRAWRDVHAVSVQITMAWDIQSVNAGRIRFGLPSLDPRL